MATQGDLSSEIIQLQSELFEDVDATLVEQWLRSCKTLEFNTGDIVIAQGEANPSVYLLVEGALTVHITSEHSSSVAVLKPGDVAGEVSALSGRETSAWVTARTKSRAIEVPRTLLLEWAEGSHQFALNLLQLSNTRLHDSNAVSRSIHANAEVLKAKAMTDSLTGLLNRHWLEINQDRFRGISLIAVDIDHFKQINDLHGHPTGDQVIRTVAQTLRQGTRPHDAVMRLGGEEFPVVVDLSRADSSPMELAERLRTAVERLQVETSTTSDGQSSLQVRISLGVATQKHAEAWEGLMERADQALYAAKQGGRNQVVQAP